MASYYMNLNAQQEGDREVHREGCSWLPQVRSKRYLGEHSACHSAVAVAKQYYSLADGCYYCSRPCHTR